MFGIGSFWNKAKSAASQTVSFLHENAEPLIKWSLATYLIDQVGAQSFYPNTTSLVPTSDSTNFTPLGYGVAIAFFGAVGLVITIRVCCCIPRHHDTVRGSHGEVIPQEDHGFCDVVYSPPHCCDEKRAEVERETKVEQDKPVSRSIALIRGQLKQDHQDCTPYRTPSREPLSPTPIPAPGSMV